MTARGKGVKFLANAGFLCRKTPVIAAVLGNMVRYKHLQHRTSAMCVLLMFCTVNG